MGAPSPEPAATYSDVVDALSRLRSWAGAPSFTEVTRRVQRTRLDRGVPPDEARVARSTVYDCFRPGRRRLDTELVAEIVAVLGADPGPWRRALSRISDPTLALATVQVHHDLPPAESSLVGRDHELRLIASSQEVTLVLEGMAGVGKTALAFEAARRDSGGRRLVRVNLDGFSADRPAADPAAVKDAIVRALLHGAVPIAALDDLYQRVLESEPVLLLLDNASDHEQVSSLLPKAASQSRAMVTSRVSFPETPGLARIELTTLDPRASAQLASQVSGQQVAADEALAEATAGLPLALVLLGQRIAAEPEWEVYDHLDRTVRQRQHLHLDDGLMGALRLSYAALPPEQQTALRLLSQAPGTDLSTEAVAALLDDEAAALDHLARAHLVRRSAAGRWELHDLVRAFALAESLGADRPSTVTAAVARLLDHYVDRAMASVAALYPRTRGDWWWAESVEPLDEATALDWLAAERSNLIRAATGAQGPHATYCSRLAAIISPFLLDRVDARSSVALQRLAIERSSGADSRPDQALAQRNVGAALVRLGKHAEGRHHLEEAIAQFEAIDDPFGVATTRNVLATLASISGEQEKSLHLFEQVRQHFEDGSDPTGSPRR